MPVSSSEASDSSHSNLDGIGEGHAASERSTDSELIVLDSLFPVVELLPGLTEETNSGYYYVQGEIQASDLESLYNYTGRIGELMLSCEAHLLHVWARIGQLQDPNKPLFPFLHRLRIVSSSLSLIFLHLFLSSSLTTIELTAIPVVDPCYSSVVSFLECAIHQTHLSTLILGPGLISDQILNISLGYKNLRCLKLLDVGISITRQLLDNIGSLQHLDTFVLRDDGTSTYSSYQQDPELDAEWQGVLAALPFSSLRILEVNGTFDLIQDLVAKVSSSDLRALSIDVTKPLEGIHPDWSTKKKSLWKRNLTSNIMALLTRSIEKWTELMSVNFKNDSPTILSLPFIVFEDLLLRPHMEHLEISGMNIASMDETLHRLTEVADSKLEVLHLPVHATAPGISFAELRHIAEACPHLHSFRCPLRHVPDVKASGLLSHQLKVLSVNTEHQLAWDELPVAWDPKVNLEIAHYLDSIFPDLRSIETHGDSENAEEWRSIFDLVKLCQAVRKEERQRRL